jgi:hypothetical protein
MAKSTAPFSQFLRTAKLTSVSLGVRPKRKSKVLIFGLARIPLLLF